MIAGAETLRADQDVGRYAFLLAGVECPGSTHAAHDLVEDQQHAILVADFADALEIARHGRDRPRCRADDRLGEERHDGLRAEFEDLLLKLVRHPMTVIGLAFAVALIAIGVTGRDHLRVEQDGLEHLAPPHIAAGRQGAQRIAVIALPPRDEMLSLRLTDFDGVLPRQLQRRFHGFRAAGDEIDRFEPGRRRRYHAIGQVFHRLAGEEPGMGEGETVHLILDRLRHFRMAMPKTGHRGTAGGVQVAVAIRIDDIDTIAM